jgi:hypothetical protein
MSSDYTELKTLPELTGSLNAIVSASHHLRRPPSLSESFAWAPENVVRAAAQQQLLRTSESNTSLFLIPTISPSSTPTQVSPQPASESKATHQSSWECAITQLLLKLLFHITLISIFESVFFFLYVSKLEDGGIQNTIGGFVSGAVNTCKNLTSVEIILVDDLLDPFLNATQVVNTAQQTLALRTAQNDALNKQSLIYVGSLGSLFVVVFIYAKIRKLHIDWNSVLLENFFMILLLAAYEYMFFTTIISPYAPISADEIAGNAIQRFQSVCGLFRQMI